jgi:adenylate cyclase
MALPPSNPLPDAVLPRRLAAIAFADIVGYSILAAADETRTAARWMAMFREVVAPAAEALGGRIVDVQGDGTLAEFSDVAAALEWARRLHAAAEGAADAHEAPITFRVAIHAGSVIVAGERIMGDVVNTAARLQEYATPGGTLLSAEAAALLGGALPPGARELGELPLRNLSRAVRAVSLDPARQMPVPLPPPPSLLPSVVVLPLANLSGDPADDHLAAGVVEDVTASLAGLHELFVVAPESARMFLGQSPTPQRVARALGVRFAVAGSLRRRGGGFQASLWLMETETGEQLWTERVDAADRDIFAMQEHLAARVVQGVAPSIRAAALQAAMRKRPESLTAYDHMLRGMHTLSCSDPERFRAAGVHLARATAEDPGFSLALAWRGYWHNLRISIGLSEDLAADREATFDLCERALATDPRNPLALAVLAHNTALLRQDCATAQALFDRALQASPNSAMAMTLSSATLAYLGEGTEAVRRAELGLRLSPHDPLGYVQHHLLAMAHYQAGDMARSERHSRISLGTNPAHGSAWRTFCVALAAQGRMEEARLAYRSMLRIEPNFDLAAYLPRLQVFQNVEIRERMCLHLTAAAAGSGGQE